MGSNPVGSFSLFVFKFLTCNQLAILQSVVELNPGQPETNLNQSVRTGFEPGAAACKPNALTGLRSSRPKVISPEVMSPEVMSPRVMLPEIYIHIQIHIPKLCRPKSCRPESCCPKFIFMLPDILSHATRNFIMLKKIPKNLKTSQSEM